MDKICPKSLVGTKLCLGLQDHILCCLGCAKKRKNQQPNKLFHHNRIIAQSVSLKNNERISQIVEGKKGIVSPGFIDIHTHNELTLLINPEADKLKMGVTTEIVGTCGVSAAPVIRVKLDELLVAFCTVGGGYGFFFNNSNVEWSWSSFEEYVEHLRKQSFSVNLGSYVGHLNLRIASRYFRAKSN